MWQSEENNIRISQNAFGIRVGENQCLPLMSEPWKYLIKSLTNRLPRSNLNEFGQGMSEKKANEFFAGVTGRTDHRAF